METDRQTQISIQNIFLKLFFRNFREVTFSAALQIIVFEFILLGVVIVIEIHQSQVEVVVEVGMQLFVLEFQCQHKVFVY